MRCGITPELVNLALSVSCSACLSVAGSLVAQGRAKQVAGPNLSPGVYLPTKILGYLLFKSIAGLHFLKKYKPEIKKQFK